MKTTFITEAEARLIALALDPLNEMSPEHDAEVCYEARGLVDNILTYRSATEWDGELPFIITPDVSLDAPVSPPRGILRAALTITAIAHDGLLAVNRFGWSVINSIQRMARSRRRHR